MGLKNDLQTFFLIKWDEFVGKQAEEGWENTAPYVMKERKPLLGRTLLLPILLALLRKHTAG